MTEESHNYVVKSFRPPVRFQIDYAAELNPQQYAAVTAPPGPCLVIAGAGSGKTRALTYRVAFLIEQGIPANRILLLTFTNKAAGEMMHRVRELLGGENCDLWGGTFHSVGARILRRHTEQLGYKPDFTILDREDALHMAQACLVDAPTIAKTAGLPKADALMDILSMSRNTMQPIEKTLQRNHREFLHLAGVIEELALLYQQRKQSTNTMDFDDLLALWLKLLTDHTDVLDRYQRLFQFILVDEYQDTNLLQSRIVDLLAAQHKNLMVVGDDSQSIYAWRGANFRNIMEFPSRYEGATLYRIETNYRSTPEILDLANAAIKPNQRQFEKSLVPARPSGPKPVLAECDSSGMQAAFVTQRVRELCDSGISLSNMAVLYRSHFHAMELQMVLTQSGIPFSITSGIRFFEQAHIKDVCAHLRLAANPGDELSFKRLALMLPGVGAKGADKLWKHFCTVRETAPSVSAALSACATAAPKKAAAEWTRLAGTQQAIESPALQSSPSIIIEHILKSGYTAYLKSTYENADSRIEDVDNLIQFARGFESLSQFLTDLALLTNIENEAAQSAASGDNRLRLSTVHQAKGLEFDVVFVISLCDGLFPSHRSIVNDDAVEEERRLFYVAVTRAKNQLYLIYPQTTGQYGYCMPQIRSRFLKDTPARLLDTWNLSSDY